MFECEVCKRGPADGVTTFRVNQKGEPGVFRCSGHAAPATDLKALTDDIEVALEEKRDG